MAHSLKSNADIIQILNNINKASLLDRLYLAISLALVVSEWSRLESHLGFCYATLLGKYLPHNQRKDHRHIQLGSRFLTL